jgi:hypothetical protein
MAFERRTIAPLAILVATLAAAAPAAADPTAAERETARSLMNDGDRKFAAKDYREALKSYEGAHAIMHVPSTGHAVAKTQAALGLLVEARDSAVLVTRMPPKPGEPAPFTQARAESEKLARDLAGRIGALQIVVEGPTDSAALKVEVDGTPISTSLLKLPIKSNPGKHVVHASAAGYADASKDITLREAETQTVTLSLAASKAPPVGPVASTGGAGPALGTVEENPAADAGGKTISPLVWIGFGTGAAGLAAGSIAGVIHLSKVSSVKEEFCGGTNDCQPGFEAARDAAKPSATISTIGFVVGAVGIGVGVIGLLTPSRAPATGFWLSPVVGAGSVGALGRF